MSSSSPTSTPISDLDNPTFADVEAATNPHPDLNSQLSSTLQTLPESPMVTNKQKPASLDTSNLADIEETPIALTYRGSSYNPQTGNAMEVPEKNRLRWASLSLRLKATLVAIVLGTAPVLVIGTVGYLLASGTVSQQVTDDQERLAGEVVDKMTRFMFERYGDVQTLANLPILANPKVRPIVTPTEKERILTFFAENYQVYDNIAVYTLDGNLFLQGGSKRDAPTNAANLDYFQTPLKTDKAYVSQPQGTKELSVFFSAPVRDVVTGQTIAVVRTRMPISGLEKVIQNLGNAERQTAYNVFDASGKIFMATKKEQVGSDVSKEFPDGLAERRSSKKPSTWIGIDQGQKTEKVLIGYAATGEFQGMPDVNWGILYTTNTNEAFKASRELLLSLTLGTGLIAILVGLLAAYLARLATRPIQEAAETVEKIGQGDLEARIQTQGEDELAVLGDNINRMAQDIQELLEQQEQAARAQIATQQEIARQQEQAAREQLAAQEEIARRQAEYAQQQQEAKEFLQNRALELLMEVSPLREGDLTIRAKVTEDEVGTIADSYNATINSLRKIVGQVQSVATQVAETAEGNKTSLSELTGDALQQADSIQIALLRIEEMSRSIQQVAQGAQEAERAVQLASETVHQGDEAMNRTVEGIVAIRETVAETAKKVKQLGESSQKISKVVNLIGTFAAQTNLLALNASIEAARAGEEGRGFAVVADEVRSLARQSAKATAEIEQLVASIQAETNEVVAAMEAGTQQVVTGTQLVEETRQSLNQIAQASDQISSLVRTITEAATSQAQASSIVSETITNVAGLANNTSYRAETVLEAFQNLLKVANDLQTTVAQFKLS